MREELVTTMHICLYLDASRTFRWHQWLAEALMGLPGYRVETRYASEQQPLPKACTLLFNTESFIYRLNRENAIGPIERSALPCGGQTDDFDIVIDCASGTAPSPASKRTLTPYFNGIPNEIGAVAGLLSDAPVSVEVHDTAFTVPWIARPAVNRELFGESLNNTLSLATGLILKALSAALPNIPPILRRGPVAELPRRITSAALARVTTTVAAKTSRFLQILIHGHHQWSVGWRIDPQTLFNKQTATYTVIPDDGKHFYADPFPLRYKGRDFIFVEDYVHANGRGCIAYSEIKNGVASTPVPIIEEPWHLSYPNVFEYNNNIWMIPESGEANAVYLYRLARFPDVWIREGCLIEKIKAYDATLVHNGKFWLFISERVFNSSTWDTLSLFHADDITGPWEPVNNPVLFDAALSRPAGAIFKSNGQYIRPVQDCSRFYGSAIQFCRIDQLSIDGFIQSVMGTVRCGGKYGCHTYNNHRDLEVIDCFGRRGVRRITATYQPSNTTLPLNTMMREPQIFSTVRADDGELTGRGLPHTS